MKTMWRSRVALALTVAGVFAAAGQAQARKEPPSGLSASADFRKAAEGIRNSLSQGNLTGASSGLSSLVATTSFEKYLKASLAMELAAKQNDFVAQRKLVAEMLESGVTPEAELPYLNHLAGYSSYQTGAVDNAIIYLSRARELGEEDPRASLLLVECYLYKKKPADAARVLDETISQQRKAGQAVPGSWYDRAAALAYARKDWAALSRYNAMKLSNEPAIVAPDWRSAISVYIEGARPDKEAQLDLYRLQAATGAMASERDYQGYATLAEAQGYSAEAQAVIDSGISDGALQSTDPVVGPLLKKIKPRAIIYLASVKGLPGKAANVADAAKAAQSGDKLLASSQFADAIPYYRAAMEKGVTDRNRVSTRLGIALARSGDFSGARTALAQVAGSDSWSQVAAYWSAWVDVRSAASASADAGSETQDKPKKTASL